MEKLYKELDDVKATVEKLTVENRAKTELSESLRAAHNEQLVRFKEAELKIERQAQDLNKKAQEITEMKQMYEESKSNLQEQESSLRQVRFAYEKLRSENHEKLKTLEGRNKELIFALDEANTTLQKQEQKILSFEEEIGHLKGLLTVSQKKASEAEQKAQILKDMRQRDDALMNLEEESTKIKDQLKWKNEQFNHLQEAHEKVQGQFRSSKKEWEQEKCTLLDEISSLENKLDSQTRISESLQHKLQLCNQALAHEESRRKVLEVQLSESKACYDDVFVECQEAKSKIETLSARRDNEIADLRNLLSTKETLYKEVDFRSECLEQENKELRASVKEFQEEQIKQAGSISSLTKLRNKLRSLEQVHKDCSAKLYAQETEWTAQMETVMNDLNQCRSELDHKDEQIKELQIELENCYSSTMQLKLQNEEICTMLTVYKSQLSDIQVNISKPEVEMELQNNKESEQKISLLIEQLDQKSNALVRANIEIKQGLEMAASLMEKIELLEEKYILTVAEIQTYKDMLEESSLQQLQQREQALQTENDLKEDLRNVSDALRKVSSELAEKIQKESELEYDLDRSRTASEDLQRRLDEEKIGPLEQKYLSTLKELDQCKQMLEESSLQQLQEKEQALLIENALKEDLRKFSDALEQAHSELAERVQEESEIEFELDGWRNAAESLQRSLDENLEFRREMEGSLLAQVEIEQNLKVENKQLLHLVEENGRRADGLQQKLDWMEQEFMRRELDSLRRELEAVIIVQIQTEKSLEKEKERLLGVVQEKDRIIANLKSLSMEHDVSWPIKVSALAELDEKQAQFNTLGEAWEKIRKELFLSELDLQLNNAVLAELEEDISHLHKKLESHEESMSCSRYQVQQLEAKQLEMEKVMGCLGNSLRTSESSVKELESQNITTSQEIAKLLSEKEELLATAEEFGKQIKGFSDEDTELMGRLGRMVEGFKSDDERLMSLKRGIEYYDSNRENEKTTPLSAKTTAAFSGRRSPLLERNN